MSAQNKTSNLVLYTVVLILISLLAQTNIVFMLGTLVVIPGIVSYIMCNHGAIKSIFSSVAVIIFWIVYSLTGYTNMDLSVAFSIILSIVSGYIIGYSFIKGFPFSYMLTFSVGIDLFLASAGIAYCKYILNINITHELQNIVTETFFMQFDLIKSMFPDAAAQLSDVEGQIFNTLYIALPGTIPFVVFVSGVVVFLVRYIVCKIICTSYLIQSEKFDGGFDVFAAGYPTLIFFALSALGVIISATNRWFMIFLCAILCVMCIYVLVSLAIIDFKLKARIHSSSKRYMSLVLIIILVFAVSLFIPIINPLYILIIVGIMDTFFDFRKLKPKKGEIYEKK